MISLTFEEIYTNLNNNIKIYVLDKKEMEEMTMLIGYCRVSSIQQNEDRQLIAMREFGVNDKNIFVDKQSGKDFERKNYKKMFKSLKKGDVLVVKSIDRLGRSYKDILNEWQKITKNKGADIVVLDMSLLDTRNHKDLLGTFICDLILQILSYVSENERANIKLRQAEGIAAAKQRGVKFGRPKKYKAEDFIEVYKRLKNGQIKKKQAMAEIGVSQVTYYRIIHELDNMYKS